MSIEVDSPAGPVQAAFACDSLELADEHLVLTGQWSGVRGMRFVRPTLIVGGRSVLATMAHKPWAPDADPWRAEFPWTDGPVDAEDVSVAVTPRLVVPLVGGTADAPPAPVPERRRFTADPPGPTEDAQAAAAEGSAKAPDPIVADHPAASPADAAAGAAEAARRAEPDRHAPQVAEAVRARVAAERERDHALERLAEAERDRDAALRTRRRMEDSSDTAERERDDARTRSEQDREAREASERERARVQAELNRSERERESAERLVRKLRSELERSQAQAEEADAARREAEAERDRIRGQRDEALLAYDTVQRRQRTESGSPPPRPEPEVAGTAEDSDDEASPATRPVEDADVPLGVRRVPAARGASADLLGTPARGRDVSTFDVWAMRTLGSVAAVCFILLMVLILRAFLL